MEAENLSKIADDAGLRSKSNQEIEAILTKMSNGNFSLVQKFEMAAAGTNSKEMQQSAKAALMLTDQDFNGDFLKALSFLKQTEGTGLGKMDINQMVESGAAHRLVQLEQQNPQAVKDIASRQYQSVDDLGKALDAFIPQAPTAPLQRPGAQPRLTA